MDKYIAGSNDTLVIKKIDYDPTSAGYTVDSFPHGSLLIQTATTNASCITSCTTRFWVVDCPEGCDEPTIKELAFVV